MGLLQNFYLQTTANKAALVDTVDVALDAVTVLALAKVAAAVLSLGSAIAVLAP